MIEEAAIALMTVYVAGMLGWIARSLRARQAKGAYNAIANEWTEKEPETLRKAAEAHNAIMRQNAWRVLLGSIRRGLGGIPGWWGRTMSSLWNNLSGRTLKSDLKTAPPEPADQGTPDAPTPANPTAEQP